MPIIPVLTPGESADWDRLAESAGIALATLMDAAGRAVADVLARRYPAPLRQGVLVACGKGNNGGDGWVVARVLHRLDVSVWVAAVPGDGSPLQQAVRERALAEGVRTVSVDGPWPNVGLVVDAILGTGASGAPREPAAGLAERLAEARVPRVAVDGPTGLDLGTGVSWGHAGADLTVTFGGLRRGHLLGREDVGDVVVVDIGHPPPDPAWTTFVTDAMAAAWLPVLRAGDHKGIHGRVAVVGGSGGMAGAVRMSARSAFAAGAGLVHAVAPLATIEAIRSGDPDIQTLVHPLEGEPGEGDLPPLENADAVVIGPGLGREPGRREFAAAVMRRARRLVVDADALTIFQDDLDTLASLVRGRPAVLTPHPGEFRSLFGDLASHLESDPWDAAARASSAVGATVLLKGVPTVVARGGRCSFTVGAGNPGLATGGSGDVLSGIIGAALARGMEPDQAAALGAQVLGRAADAAARRTTARALRPLDVIGAFPELWRTWSLPAPAARPPVLLDLPAPATV